MSLTERFLRNQKSDKNYHNEQLTIDEASFDKAKLLVHEKVVEIMDLSSIMEMPREELERSVRDILIQMLETEKIPLNRAERSRLISELLNEILGLGPIELLIHDESVQDILINGSKNVYIEKQGVIHQTAIHFRNDEHLMQVIDKIVSKVGRRVDESSPMVDVRLPDGSRVNVIIPPVALDGPQVSIRKFGDTRLTQEGLLQHQSATAQMTAYLQMALRSKLNILISGGTGSGKTTLLNILSGHIPHNERIVTIEDIAELKLNQPHVVRLESRPENIESRGEITLTDLVKNSLRMRPDRIIVGETRGGEVLNMLQAMNTGHPGSMSTIHANSPRDAFSRMEVMIGMAPTILSERGAKGLIASAINVIVQCSRLVDGSRKVISISEVCGIEDGEIMTHEIFIFEQQGISEEGRVYGCFKPVGSTSIYKEHFLSNGMELPPALFHFQQKVR